jgi:hypothetical protein
MNCLKEAGTERREKPAQPPLAPMCGSPASVSAYCRQLSFSPHRKIIEFRVGSWNQHLARIIIEHQSERNHFDLRSAIGLPVEIDHADDISGFAVPAVSAFDQSDAAVPVSLLQRIKVGSEEETNRTKRSKKATFALFLLLLFARFANHVL